MHVLAGQPHCAKNGDFCERFGNGGKLEKISNLGGDIA